MSITTFDNHPPINFSEAKQLASARRDGGCYDGIGYDTYRVYQGQRVHLVHFYSSGCQGSGTTSEHLWSGADAAACIAHLLTLDSSWWMNELLTELGYQGEPA